MQTPARSIPQPVQFPQFGNIPKWIASMDGDGYPFPPKEARVTCSTLGALDVNRRNVWTAVVEKERTDIDKGAF